MEKFKMFYEQEGNILLHFGNLKKKYYMEYVIMRCLNNVPNYSK